MKPSERPRETALAFKRRHLKTARLLAEVCRINQWQLVVSSRAPIVAGVIMGTPRFIHQIFPKRKPA